VLCEVFFHFESNYSYHRSQKSTVVSISISITKEQVCTKQPLGSGRKMGP